nr:hypothetical protein [Tanacetum cinerariifolium]
MDSLTSSQANQPYSLINCVTLDMDFEQLINNYEYYQSQDYSIGQGSTHGFANGSAHGSTPVDDDDSPVEEMSPVKAKKPSKHASRAKKNDAKEKKAPKDWTKAEDISIQKGKKSKTLETTSGLAYGGFNLNNEADEYEKEAREHLLNGS